MVSTEVSREVLSVQSHEQSKSALGQYFTPPSVAQFMAGLFSVNGNNTRLLDPGAGTGSLSAAFLDRMRQPNDVEQPIELTAWEIDPALLPGLSRTIQKHSQGLSIKATILQEDFVESAVNRLQFCPQERFSHAILNPPYRKIATQSRARRLLRQVGIETVNLYAGFVALSIALLEAGGQLVAITPRSFCNGPYYRSFRDFVLARCAIRHIHLFQARDKAFGEDDVLQENVIFLLVKRGKQGDVTVSTSTDHLFADYAERTHPFREIIPEDHPERFIHIPVDDYALPSEYAPQFKCSLADVGLTISTGPVVDFRVQEYLRTIPEDGCAPLFYPAHVATGSVTWPLYPAKKPNAIVIRAETQQWLYPAGYYTVVRRLSAKEEKRRIVASLVTPDAAYGPFIGFENHLNVFHVNRSGLPEMLARGLMVYLNSTLFDQSFRRFSGHTQVNATDLRNMQYPSQETLSRLGYLSQGMHLSQDQIDRLVASLT